MSVGGATTIGLVYKDGVILASEKRMAWGTFILSQSAKKVFKISDNVAAACAGLVSDMQAVVRLLSAYSNLFRLDRHRRIKVRAAAKLLSTFLFQRRLLPYLTQTIVGGVDEDGPALYSLDALGSVIPDKYACVGTGAEIAMGVLEAEYRPDMSLEEAKELVIRAMKTAMARDAASGGGIDLVIITKDGIKEESIQIK